MTPLKSRNPLQWVRSAVDRGPAVARLRDSRPAILRTRPRHRLLAAGTVAAMVIGSAAGLVIGGPQSPEGRSTELERVPTTEAAPQQASASLAAPPPTPVAPPPTTTPPASPPPQPAATVDPVALGAQITASERAVIDPATPAADLPRWGYAQQTAYRTLIARPELVDQVRAHVAPDVRSAFEQNLAAGHALRSMVKKLRTTLPRWEIIRPEPADALLSYYRAAEAEFGVPWQYLAAINLVETRMGRIRGLSSAGAQGPMQFMPATWAAYGEGDVTNPRDAIRGAARYLQANGAPHDMHNALWHYNRDTRYVRAVMLYAERMMADERAYAGYYHWEVIYLTVDGDVHLPVGWVHPEGAVTG